MKELRWLDRELVRGPFLALATSELAFYRAMQHLKVPQANWNTWLPQDAYGRTHILTNPEGSVACVVCVRVGEQQGIDAASTLIHEAVHVWQAWCKYRGEAEPSIEFEAYSIESIARRLMQAYAKHLT